MVINDDKDKVLKALGKSPDVTVEDVVYMVLMRQIELEQEPEHEIT
tara:strand:+ start:198 stop:335 length:138 start_codon:yes stop_codon:yes gene_type:complete